MAGLVTLTTDFGLRDAYVAEMKGVMLGIARKANQSLQLVDVTHDVERHDITEGALALEAAAPFFPPGTVHPILTRFEGIGWLESFWEDVEPREAGRPRRRYFRLTRDGAELARNALVRAEQRSTTSAPYFRPGLAGGAA